MADPDWRRAWRPTIWAPISKSRAEVAETLPAEDRIEIHKAGVRMAAGHLRSQIRYHATKKACLSTSRASF